MSSARAASAPRDDMPGPFEGMSDTQVLARAARALRNVQDYPVGSVQRATHWAVYSEAKAELDRRLLDHMVRKLRERGRSASG